eukprot:scaffold1105_cov184-Ochromonas_danica.AAC.4
MGFLPLPIPSILSSRVCGGCHQPIVMGQYLTFQGQEYHSACFLCAGCGLPIEEGQPFAVKPMPSSPSSPGREVAYHPTCYQELFSPHCTLCHKVLDGCTVLKHPFFEKEVYCIEHLSNPQCCSCQRRLLLEGIVDLLDGRSLCSVCSKTIIMENSEAADVFQEVLVYLRQELQVEALPTDLLAVPVLTVDLQSLSNQQATSCWVEDSSIVRGLTLSSQRIVREPIATTTTRLLFSSSSSTTSSSLLFPHESYEQQTGMMIRYEQEVTAILVLNGLPRDLTGSILAHEAMHAFLRLFVPPPPCSPSHPFQLPRDLEEGLCQLIAFHYLDYLSENRVRRRRSEEEQEQEQEELRGCFRYQISSDPSVVYGDSFRKVRKVQAVMGWPMLLEHLAQSSELPDIPDNDDHPPC